MLASVLSSCHLIKILPISFRNSIKNQARKKLASARKQVRRRLRVSRVFLSSILRSCVQHTCARARGRERHCSREMEPGTPFRAQSQCLLRCSVARARFSGLSLTRSCMHPCMDVCMYVYTYARCECACTFNASERDVHGFMRAKIDAPRREHPVGERERKRNVARRVVYV